MSLETKYRRLVRLFPAEWRARNEEELIATLLDAAEPDRSSVSPAEAADLIRSALVMRIRASFARRSARVVGGREAVRLAGLVTLAVVSTVACALVIRSWTSDVSVEFLVTSLVVVLIPGAGVVYTVSSAISGGWRRGLFGAVGCTLGIVPHVLAAMLGLSGVMQAGAAAFEVVRWAGVAYLVFMGVSMIRERGGLQLNRESHGGKATNGGTAMATVVRRGILVNLLNPKLTVFFLAFLPQFLDSPPGLLDLRLVGLSGIFMLMTLVVFAVYAWASAIVRDRVLGSPTVVRWVQRSLGTVLVGFAARLATTDR